MSIDGFAVAFATEEELEDARLRVIGALRRGGDFVEFERSDGCVSVLVSAGVSVRVDRSEVPDDAATADADPDVGADLEW